MERKLIFTLLCCVCTAVPLAAQTAAPEGMALIPAGKFWMGRSFSIVLNAINVMNRDRMDDTPANNIYLDAFYIDKYEVTNADYARFLAAMNGKLPWHWPQGKIPKGEERWPIYNVNWFEATAYCKWVGKRLPTEAEWEKAARGGLDRNRYSWGDKDVEVFEEKLLPPQWEGKPKVPEATGGLETPMPVGSFQPTGYVLYDVSGSVAEWLSHWYYDNYYPFMPKQNPRGPETGLYRSVRGASWVEGGGDENAYGVYYRNYSDPELRINTIGFRCAK